MKTCNKCKIPKSLDKFYDDNYYTDGKTLKCKSCCALLKRTLSGLVSSIYSSQISASKKRKHNPPNYGKAWLADWLLNQDLYYSLHHRWVMCDYDSKLRPSVDRLNDSIGYTKDNIQLMTWKENDLKAKRAKKSFNTSGVLGVSYRKLRGKWIAVIYFDFKQKQLYYGNSFEEACLHRRYAEECLKLK